MTARGTLQCTVCGVGIPVTFTRASAVRDGQVHMLMDTEPLEVHMRTCGTQPAAVEKRKVDLSVSPLELSGRVDRFLNARAPHGGRFFVAQGGSRACTMCGMAGASCLSLVGQNTREACCAACANGNTHPAPGGGMGCAEWAVIHGAKD